MLYFPTSFEHQPVFEGGIFRNREEEIERILLSARNESFTKIYPLY